MSGDAQGGSDRRRRLLLAGLALLVVLGVGLGAAGLEEIRLSSASGSGGVDTDEPVDVGDTVRGATSEADSQGARMSPYWVLGFFVLMLLASVAVAWHRDVITAWTAMAVMIVVFVFLVFVGDLGQLELATTNSSANVTEPPNQSSLGSGSGTEPGSSPPATALPTGLLVFLGFIVGLSAVLGFSRADAGDDEDEAGEAGEAADEETVVDIGAAAGQAADRMAESGDLDNPVYEAWRDMTAALDDPDERTLTPAEFRDRAVAAGLPREPVGDLTDVFREVRYGQATATEGRVGAAESALRQVEEAADSLTSSEETSTAEPGCPDAASREGDS